MPEYEELVPEYGELYGGLFPEYGGMAAEYAGNMLSGCDIWYDPVTIICNIRIHNLWSFCCIFNSHSCWASSISFSLLVLPEISLRPFMHL